MALDPFFGSVLSGATSLIGGLFGGESQRKANENAKDAAEHARRQQDELAKRGITYRVRDIMNAYQESGINPLALLGVQGPTYSPVTPAFLGGNPVGEGIARAGQDISRGIHATADRELRAASIAMQKKAMDDAAERGGLENQLLRVKIASEMQRLHQMSSPPMPSANQRYEIPGSVSKDSFWNIFRDPSKENSVPGVS